MEPMVTDNKIEFANRLNKALDLNNVPPKGHGRQIAVAKMFHVSQKGARKWLEGESIPDTKRIPDIARRLKVTGEWLLTGMGSIKDESASFSVKLPAESLKDPHALLKIEEVINGTAPGAKIKELVPLIDWKQAARWWTVKYNLKIEEAIEWRGTTAKLGSFPLALRIKDDSMTNPAGFPSFPERCVVIFDTQLEAEPGKFVLAVKRKSEEPIFAQLVSIGSEKYLKPLNPRYPIVLIDDTWEVIGVAKTGVIDIES